VTLLVITKIIIEGLCNINILSTHKTDLKMSCYKPSMMILQLKDDAIGEEREGTKRYATMGDNSPLSRQLLRTIFRTASASLSISPENVRVLKPLCPKHFRTASASLSLSQVALFLCSFFTTSLTGFSVVSSSLAEKAPFWYKAVSSALVSKTAMGAFMPET